MANFVLLLSILGPLMTAGQMTAVPGYQLSALNQHGGIYLGEQIVQGTNALNGATATWNDAVRRCEQIAASKERPCVDCVKRKCQDKASSCDKQLTFSGVINSITDLGSQAISSITNIGSSVIGTVVDTGKKVISEVGKVFKGWGRRRRDMMGRASEPSCSEFNSQESAAAACQKYAHPDFCPDCQMIPSRDCPGYSSAQTAYNNANNEWGWLREIGTNKNYQINSASYDPASFDPATQKYRTVWLSVNIFGRQTTFYSSSPLSVFEANVAGRDIAAQALNWFKQNA